MEGFPNIFIEAWACGVPVLSLHVDPGGVIKKEGLGEIADGNINTLVIGNGSISDTQTILPKRQGDT